MATAPMKIPDEPVRMVMRTVVESLSQRGAGTVGPGKRCTSTSMVWVSKLSFNGEE